MKVQINIHFNVGKEGIRFSKEIEMTCLPFYDLKLALPNIPIFTLDRSVTTILFDAEKHYCIVAVNLPFKLFQERSDFDHWMKGFKEGNWQGLTDVEYIWEEIQNELV